MAARGHRAGRARVGVIGAGATTVQLVPRIAPVVGHLTVFQRTPNWCFPMKNMPMPADYEATVKAMYPELRRHEQEQPGRRRRARRVPGPVAVVDEASSTSRPRSATRSSRTRWADCALHLGEQLQRPDDEPRGQRHAARVHRAQDPRDGHAIPTVADRLIPTNHPPFTRRPCGEAGYYEAFNRDNVDARRRPRRPDRRDHADRTAPGRAAPSTSSTC